MPNFKKIDIPDWGRKRQFAFFSSYDEPFFNITANVDIGKLPEYCKSRGLSFNLAVIFASQKVIHAIPEFRMRISGQTVREYSSVNCGSTILLPDNTFSFCYFEFDDDLASFHKTGKANIEKLMHSKDFNPRHEDLDIVHYSTIPWIKFTSIKHPRKFGNLDSIPKIIFGKRFEENGKHHVPVSVEAHHGLVDGYHMGLYFDGLSREIQEISLSNGFSQD